jgi:hypothetical protein
MMNPTVEEVRKSLRAFVAGDGSPSLAAQIEVGLDMLFPDDVRFEDLVLALASYQPGGGELLFDYERVLPLCRAALKELESMR